MTERALIQILHELGLDVPHFDVVMIADMIDEYVIDEERRLHGSSQWQDVSTRENFGRT